MDYGIVVDVETTGIDALNDRIIELGMILFAVEADKPPQITAMYSGIEDPGRKLAPEIIALTGLNDEILRGQKIDWELVRATFAKASVAIAHNAAFDSAFLKARPELQPLTIPWACSMKHVNWEVRGFRTRALNYLACDHGFVNPFPHRALFDCATTFRLIQPHLDELASRCYMREVRVVAVGVPFEKKDVLKQHRYRWDGERRVWFKDLIEDQLPEERSFLKAEVYMSGHDRHEEVFSESGIAAGTSDQGASK